MSNFSKGTGAPLTRHQESLRSHRGRRSGKVAPCRARLEGWIRNVADRSTIWGDIDLEAFCLKTGYSREHATRELSKIRRESSDLAFETKMRRKKGSSKKCWGVIVANCSKLLFDRRSLFYDLRGNRLHNYTKLGTGGEKIAPSIPSFAKQPRQPGRPRKRTSIALPMNQIPSPSGLPPSPSKPDSGASSNQNFPDNFKSPRLHFDFLKNAGLCDNANNRKDFFEIQQSAEYGGQRDMAQYRAVRERGAEANRLAPLRRKAFVVVERLAEQHWDNCKVIFARRTAYRFALDALVAGHEENRLLSCYYDALFICHGLAVDRAASTGQIVFFNLSSTVTKARRLLAKDGMASEERITLWYRNHPRSTPASAPPIEAVPRDIAELRRKIAASLGCEIPEGQSPWKECFSETNLSRCRANGHDPE